jgi:hypothetical protein
LSINRIRPGRSVKIRLPSGRKAADHGISSLVATGTARGTSVLTGVLGNGGGVVGDGDGAVVKGGALGLGDGEVGEGSGGGSGVGNTAGAAHALTSNRIMPGIRYFAFTIIVNHR